MHVRQTICVFTLLVYLEYFFVFFHSLITYAWIIAVYRYRATLVNLLYLGFAPLLTVLLYLNLRLNLFISTYFSWASTASLNLEINITFDGKLFLWDCRRSQTLPKIQGLKSKLKIKYETEKNINKKNLFEKKWVLTPMPILFYCLSIVI